MNQCNDAKNKANYAITEILKLKQNILSKDLVTWLKSVSDITPSQFHDIVKFVQQLIDLGYDPQKAAEQFKYVSDLQAYDRIEQLLTQVIETNAEALGVETQVLESGEPIFYLQEIANKVEKKIINSGDLDLAEGFLVITINKLRQYEDGLIYDESNGIVKIIVREDLERSGYNYEIRDVESDNLVVTFFTPFDQLLGFQSVSHINNNDQHVLHFIKTSEDKYTVETLLVTVDAEKLVVDLEAKNSIDIDSKQLITILNPLPRNCQVITTGFPLASLESDLLTYHTEFQSIYLEHRIRAIKSTILLDFDRKYAKDITYGLYGQSALVTLSTLTESLKTVVRKLNVDYQFKDGAQVTVPIVPEEVQKYDLPTERQNRLDIFGPCGVPSSAGTDLHWMGMVRERDYPKFRIYDPHGASNGTGYSLSDYRATAKTGTLTKKRDDGTSIEVPYFIECDVKVNTQEDPIVGNFMRVGGVETDTIDLVPIMSIWNQSRINIWGLQLNIGSDDVAFSKDQVAAYNPVTAYIGAKIKANVTRSYRVVIKLEDVSSADTTPPNATIKFIRNKEEKEVTIPLTFTQLQFGQTGFYSCYVGILDTETLDDEFYIGMPVSMDLAETQQDVYTDFDGDWKPINVKSFSYPGSVIDTKQADIANFSYWMITRQLDAKDFWRPMCYLQRKMPPLNHNFTYGPVSGLQYNLPGNTWPFIDTTPTILKKYQWHITVPTDSRIVGQAFGQIAGFTPVFNFGFSLEWRMDGDDPIVWDRNVKFIKYQGGIITTTERWILHDYNTKEGYPLFTNDIRIESKSTESSVGNCEITALDFNTSELILPDNTLNQDNIGQSIIELQRAVRMLESYAVYLEYYLKNLDKRLGFVEDTLKKVVEILEKLMNPPIPEPSGWTIATTILNFIGQGIGMFFPLIGMAISAVGLAVAGIGEITSGDILAGVLDLTFAAVLGSVGSYKFSQRLKRKYGGDELPELTDKHQISKIGEKLGTTVIENKVIIIVQSGPKPSSRKGTALVRTNTVTKVDDVNIEFTTGTITTPAINRAKWATIVRNKIPNVDVISGRTSISTRRVTGYTKGSDGNYTVISNKSETGLGYVNRASKSDKYKWQGFTDEEVKTFTRCNVSSSTYANMLDSIGISKLRGANAGSVGLDLDVAAEFLTRLGYKINRQTKYSTYASKLSKRTWTIKPFDLMQEDTISYQISSNVIFTGLSDNYQSQDSLSMMFAEVVGQ